MRKPFFFNCGGQPRTALFTLTLVLAVVSAALQVLTWSGCASRARTVGEKKDATLARGKDDPEASKGHAQDQEPGGGKKSTFTQRYEVAKYLVSTGELKEAASRLRKLRRTAKSHLEKAMATEGRASLYLARGELSRAEEHASGAIKTHPSFAPAYRTRALIRKEKGNLSGAVQDFHSALALEPEDTESLRGLAEAYLAQRYTKGAVKVLETFLEVDPLDAWAQDTWCTSMASLLARAEFPLDYLRTLNSPAVTRGELAAVLVVELEMVRLGPAEEDWHSGIVATQSGPSVLSDSEHGHSQRVARRLPETQPEQPQPESGVIDFAKDDFKIPGAELNERRNEQVGISDCEQVWFGPFVEQAVRMGVLDLYPDSTLRPWDIVRKGHLAVELYYFLSRDCEDALTAVRNSGLKSTSGFEEDFPFENALGPGYLDIDRSSYLWKPILSLVQLGILVPDSDIIFGVNSTLSGREVRRIARILAGVMISSGCKADS